MTDDRFFALMTGPGRSGTMRTMKSETLTVGTDGGSSRRDVAPGPVLVVVEHPDRARIGDRLSLEIGKPLVLGRKSPDFGPAPLSDAKISTAHVEVVPDDDRLSLRDAGSKNGAFIADANGVATRVGQVTVERGGFFRSARRFFAS